MTASAKRAPKEGAKGTSPPRRKPSTPVATPSRSSSPIAPGDREATVHEAKTHLSRLLAEVEAGGTVVITRRGKPVAKLEAIRRRGPRVPGRLKGIIAFDESFFDPLPDDELELWGEI